MKTRSDREGRGALVLAAAVALAMMTTLLAATSASAEPISHAGPAPLSRPLASQKARVAVESEFFIDFSGGHRPLRLSRFHRYSATRVSFRFFTYFTNTGLFKPVEEFPCFGQVTVARARPSGSIGTKVVSARHRGSACGGI